MYSIQTHRTNYIQTWYMYIYTSKHLSIAQITKTSKGIHYTMASVNKKDACIVLTESETRTSYQVYMHWELIRNQDQLSGAHALRIKIAVLNEIITNSWNLPQNFCLNIAQCSSLSMHFCISIWKKFKHTLLPFHLKELHKAKNLGILPRAYHFTEL